MFRFFCHASASAECVKIYIIDACAYVCVFFLYYVAYVLLLYFLCFVVMNFEGLN